MRNSILAAVNFNIAIRWPMFFLPAKYFKSNKGAHAVQQQQQQQKRTRRIRRSAWAGCGGGGGQPTNQQRTIDSHSRDYKANRQLIRTTPSGIISQAQARLNGQILSTAATKVKGIDSGHDLVDSPRYSRWRMESVSCGICA